MSSFSGILHNRTSGEQTSVTVFPEPGALRITGVLHHQSWLPADLSSARHLPDGSVILQNGNLYLEVTDPAFAAALIRSFGNKRLFRRSFFDRIGVAGCLLVIFLLILPMVAAYIWLVPKLADNAAQKVSPETEKQIGDAWFESLTAGYPVDSTRTRLVQQFYDSLGFGGAYKMTITVVHEPVVNAFAVPGGHIVVFDSIIGLMDAPEQLAGLLAHEASHIQLKHSIRAIYRELANSVFLSLIFGGQGDLTGIVTQHGGQLAGLSYSRQLELEADENGLKLMEANSIPLRGIPDLFEKMGASAGDNKNVPSFLSTHPAIEERVRIANERIAKSSRVSARVPAPLERIWGEIKQDNGW